MARAGRVIARGTQDRLTRDLPGELRLRLEPGAGLAALPASIAGRATVTGDELHIITTSPPADLAAMLAAGYAPVWVDVRRPDLDDLYRALATEYSHVA